MVSESVVESYVIRMQVHCSPGSSSPDPELRQSGNMATWPLSTLDICGNVCGGWPLITALPQLPSGHWSPAQPGHNQMDGYHHNHSINTVFTTNLRQYNTNKQTINIFKMNTEYSRVTLVGKFFHDVKV